MSRTERLAPPRLALLDLHVLVAVADDFLFPILTRLDHKLFLGMARRSLWLVARHGLLVDLAALSCNTYALLSMPRCLLGNPLGLL